MGRGGSPGDLGSSVRRPTQESIDVAPLGGENSCVMTMRLPDRMGCTGLIAARDQTAAARCLVHRPLLPALHSFYRSATPLRARPAGALISHVVVGPEVTQPTRASIPGAIGSLMYGDSL